jgi:hypothetical protein
LLVAVVVVATLQMETKILAVVVLVDIEHLLELLVLVLPLRQHLP